MIVIDAFFADNYPPFATFVANFLGIELLVFSLAVRIIPDSDSELTPSRNGLGANRNIPINRTNLLMLNQQIIKPINQTHIIFITIVLLSMLGLSHYLLLDLL